MRHRLLLIALSAAILTRLCTGQTPPTDEDRIRSLIVEFANARNAHDGQAVAAKYSEDGEWIGSGGLTSVKGRAALADMWGKIEGQVQRTVESIQFAGSNIATVRVATLYADPIGLRHEVFIVVKEPWTTQWDIRIHQTL